MTSNENESNSFVPRIRNLYAALDANEYGMHVLAGQNWSLATMNSKGITPRNEVTPPTIDSQYVPGFVWKRQPQIRLVKDFGKRVVASRLRRRAAEPALGLHETLARTPPRSLVREPPEPSNSGHVPTHRQQQPEQHHELLDRPCPDVIGKAAYEAKNAERDVHLEAFGLYRNLYDGPPT